MADVAISYAHNTRADAAALRDALIREGVTVWMDDPGEHGVIEVGIPVGGSHWDVIEHEFAAASCIAVLDTPDWRQRDYCQREYRRCRDLGKPISFIQPGALPAGVAEIVEVLTEQRLGLEAHARLALRCITSATPSSSWLQRLSTGRTDADARTVLTLEDAPFTVTPEIRSIIEDDLARASHTRRLLRRTVTGSVVVFSILAAVALGAWYLASMWLGAAAESRSQAEAAGLMERAQAAVDTLQAVEFAKLALELHPGTETLEVLAAAELRDRRTRVLEIPSDEYLGASWSADEQLVYIHTADSIETVDVRSGTLGQLLEVEHPIRSGTLVASSTLGILYVDTSGGLRRVHPDSGEVELLDEGLSTIALSQDGTLVGSGRSGSIFTITLQDGVATRGAALDLPHHARSIDIADDVIVALDDDGWLREITTGPDGLVQSMSVKVSERSLTDSSGWRRSSVTICESAYVGSFVPGYLGVKFSWGLSGSTLATERSVQLTAPVCAGESVFATTLVRGDVKELFGNRSVQLPSDVYQLLSVRDPQHERIAYLSSLPGRLLIIDPAVAIIEQDLGSVTAALYLGRATLLVGENGEITELDSGESYGALQYPPTMWVRQGCDAIIVAPQGLHHVSCDSPLRKLSGPEEFAGLRAAATGEDFVVSRFGAVEILSRHGELKQRIALDFTGDDSVIEADLSSDGRRIAFITVSGLVHEAPVDAPASVKVIAKLPGGNYSYLAYLPDGSGLVVVGGDGRARRFDSDGKLMVSRQLGFRPEGLLTDGELLLAISPTGGSAILAQDTLGVVERFQRGSLMTSDSLERFAFLARGGNSTLLRIPGMASVSPQPTEPEASVEPSEGPPLQDPSESVLTFSGLGRIQLGDTAQDLSENRMAVNGECGWESSPDLFDKGVWLEFDEDERLSDITLRDGAIRTEDGARVGMSIAAVADIYGDRFTIETKEGNGGPFEVGVVRQQDRELVFMIPWEDGTLRDDSLVELVALRVASPYMFGGC